jgi:hypothetical protein
LELLVENKGTSALFSELFEWHFRRFFAFGPVGEGLLRSVGALATFPTLMGVEAEPLPSVMI